MMFERPAPMTCSIARPVVTIRGQLKILGQVVDNVVKVLGCRQCCVS